MKILKALWQFCSYVFVPQRRPTNCALLFNRADFTFQDCQKLSNVVEGHIDKLIRFVIRCRS